ncbi:MAG: hypothetical protein H6958_11740 [Chromatiaceae bacterium]|nr:hypothetical protein [Chromatiaceae bacterium]
MATATKQTSRSKASSAQLHRDMQDFAKKMRQDREKAKTFLANAGITTKTGKLKSPYRSK